jgi:pimeloyl-ACP methyl ester carboxylesterase
MGVPRKSLTIEGVRVETYGTASIRPPLLFVHGGTQGSWAWENMAPRLAEFGWYSVCPNWFGHNGSQTLPEHEALTRSIAAVSKEIGLVCNWLDRAPAIVAHSMGGLAALAYASQEHSEIAALVLISPVVPASHGGAEIPIPVDPSTMFLPPTEMSAQLFWDAVDPKTAERYASMMSPESPRAILEATRWLLDVDTSGISAPAYVFGADRDLLVPEPFAASLAASLGAKYTKLTDQGHGVPLNPIWESVTTQINDWLTTVIH